jgi:dCMP deaminase
VIKPTSWAVRMLLLAKWWSQWSTCRWMSTGAVVYDEDFQVLVSGYNGAARGQPHCNVSAWPREEHKYRCLHAERNCIAQAARLGISIHGARMASLHRPCAICVPHIIQVGIVHLTYSEVYESDGAEEAALSMLTSAGITVVRVRV